MTRPAIMSSEKRILTIGQASMLAADRHVRPILDILSGDILGMDDDIARKCTALKTTYQEMVERYIKKPQKRRDMQEGFCIAVSTEFQSIAYQLWCLINTSRKRQSRATVQYPYNSRPTEFALNDLLGIHP